MSARTFSNRDDLAARAVALRIDGRPYRLIGQRLGVSAMTALALCREHIHGEGPHADRLRALELGRLDRQLETLAERRAELASAHQFPGAA